ncbi:carbonic anhydrase family protein [Xanthomarina sp. GH4-25]|uniref:carbonic anhydrase family protein n=1 Tax=Xanthomarina sp. GH4-25 TaxID=3349335 RepID=UPI003877A231
MNHTFKITFLAFVFVSFTACKQENKTIPTLQPTQVVVEKPITGLVEDVITKEQQKALTPDMVIQSLKDGNVRFTNNDLTSRNHSQQVRNSSLSQHPKAIILSCIDSRVPVEDVFDRGIGGVFVARVAGNFSNEDILGSMEYACKVSGSKLVLVLGHEYCGAIKASIDDVQLGNITPMLQKIKPAIDNVVYDGERNSNNEKFVHLVCESNIENTMNQIRLNSPILKDMEANGDIKIIGGIYNMSTGLVEWLE